MKRKLSLSLFKTIKSRLIAVSLIFLALGIILSVQITSQIFLKQIQLKNEEETVSKFSHTANQINEILSSSATYANLLHNENDIYNYLITEYSSADNLQKTLERISFLNTAKSYYSSSRDLYAVLFFKEDGTMCGASGDWNFFMEEEPHPFFGNYIQGNINIRNNTVWITAFPKKAFTLAKSPDYLLSNDILICGLRKITYALQPGRGKALYMVVLVKEESIRNCFKYITDEDSNVLLLDSSGASISGENMQFGATPDYYDKINLESQYGSFSHTTDDLEYQIVYYQLYSPDWVLIKRTPISIQYESIRTLRNISLIIGTVSILVAGALYTVWAIRFTRPLNQITKALNQVHKGNLTVNIPENSNIEEINQMQKQFNQMIGSINDSLEQIEIDEQEKLILEIRNLQAQINPHFIYNSITSIRWMATLSGADKVSDMLVVLSDLLHPIFNEWTLEWTLDDELCFSENYIKLMRLRYGNRVSIKIQKEISTKSSESINIPRFILQPLLENSCEHGLKRDQSLLIKIQIYYSTQDFIILVTDDGVGFSNEAINQYNENFSDSSYTVASNTVKETNGRGIGLINVNRRLKMYYGEDYGLTIIDPPDGGSCIEVKLGMGNG